MLLAEDELETPSEEDLFNCILNQGQVNQQLADISKKFKGLKGPILAATCI